MKMAMRFIFPLLLVGLSLIAETAAAVTLEDNFTGTSSTLDWTALEGACLTAGDNSGTIPACKGLGYYGSQQQTGLTNNADSPGYGALRLTNGCANGTCYYHQAGAIISNTTYPTNDGVQVTFTTYTYGGDNQGGHGADGIGFYLIDGTQAANLGAWGGSLGYSCSNSNNPYKGMVGAYLGLGIDEYGNFLNPSDNTHSGPGFQPGRIGMRGYGNIAWSWLNANYPDDYPSTLSSSNQLNAVKNTCKSGDIWNYDNYSTQYYHNKAYTYLDPQDTGKTIADYDVIPNSYVVLPSDTPIANESATKRTQATPVSYKLKVTHDGLLSLWYSYNGGSYVPVLTKQSITSANGPLPSSFKFGFGGSTGGSDNVHEITCFQAAPANQSASSASLNVQQSGEVKTGTQVYLAYYHTDNWWGQLTSHDLLVNSSTGAASISSTANWDASCVLTGGDCPSTGATGMTAESGRTLLTWSGSQGISLNWSSLTSTEQGWLNDDNEGQYRLSYLTGDRSNEIDSSGAGMFRARSSVLGDIIHSSPVWVGPPESPYPDVWTDDLAGGTAGSVPENGSSVEAYSAFKSTYATRTNMVYDGANDGFLHGFETGAYDSSGNYDATANDGNEKVAYMPQAVLKAIHNSANSGVADYSSVHYAHNYFLDATPGTGDLFYNKAWHTWLVGGLGAGGKAIYALDITDPTKFSTTSVLGEWGPSTLSCTNNSQCGQYLGKTYGTPQIRRLHNGKWAILFGNGLDSAGGHAGMYVMTVDPSTGAFSDIYFLDTGAGSSTAPDGIAYVTPADLDGDHITDYVYGGDVDGNLWRFDLTSSDPSKWHVSTFGGTTPNPLFSTPNNQPITTKVMVLSTASAKGRGQLMVDFGTGQSISQTADTSAQYATGQQSLYGILDWDMGGWNSLGSKQYASWTGLSSAPSPTNPITTKELQAQTITGAYNTSAGAVTGYRTVSNNSLSSGQFGWYLDLPGYLGVTGIGSSNQTEQVVFNPIESFGAFVVNTVIPPNNSPFTCSVKSAEGWTMALNPATGAALPVSYFSNISSESIVSGVTTNATGSPSVVSANVNGKVDHYLINQTSNGQGVVQQINPEYSSNGGQLTWAQIR